jgi:hypothetical protein
MRYRAWPCDDGTIDICDDDGVVFTNVDAVLAERFITAENQRLELMRALDMLKQSGLFDGLFRE